MTPSTDCLFCRIAAQEIPAELLWADDAVVAFRDIAPQAPTHILIIPRQHVTSALDLTPEHHPILGEMIAVAQQLAVREGLHSMDRGFRLVINTGAHGGQSVFHLHLHLLGGRDFSWPPG